MNKKFKRVREESKVTRSEVARDLNIPEKQLEEFEEGKRDTLFTAADLDKLAKSAAEIPENTEELDMGRLTGLGRELMKLAYKSMLKDDRFVKEKK